MMRKLRKLADRTGWTVEGCIREAIAEFVAKHSAEEDLEEKLSVSVKHAYEIRPRKDKRGFDLISDALAFGGAVELRSQTRNRIREPWTLRKLHNKYGTTGTTRRSLNFGLKLSARALAWFTNPSVLMLASH